MADNSARIAELQEILRSGVSSVSTDGTSMSRDLTQVRRELRQLLAEDDLTPPTKKRPVVSQINLSNC